MTVAGLIELLKQDERYKKAIVHHQYIPPVPARTVSLEPLLSGPIAAALRRTGINSLYSHQAEAVCLVKNGRNVIVSTPTASGKTLIYNLPVIEACLAQPETRALYIYPLKALEQDQKRKLAELFVLIEPLSGLRAEIYDGDTSSYRRSKILAEFPNVILTNPDMLHLSVLGYHQRWEEFFKGLRFVVVDELHTYKGIFGAHFSAVLRRLERLCSYYGSRPIFIAGSATIGNPQEFAETLFRLPFTVVDKSGAPSAGRHFLFVNPQEVKTSTLAARFLRDFVVAGLKTIAFTKSRRNTELIHNWILHQDKSLAGRISSYRAGYLPSERREIEKSLAENRLDAVISTSALEMGIDIGGLDACLLVGYPGTVSSTWQRGGRVGRSGRESVIVLIAQPDALDQYFMRHPQDFFRRGWEKALLDPENLFILSDHLVCAAAEIPIQRDEWTREGDNYRKAVEELKLKGRLLEDVNGEKLFSAAKYPHRTVNLRQTGEEYSILDISTDPPSRVGSVGGSRALAECHTGAIYLHRARQFVVRRLDLEKHNIYVSPSDDPYYTNVLIEKDTEILEIKKSKPAGNFIIRYGRLKVTEHFVGFQKRSIFSQELISNHELDLPPLVFETTGLWIEVPDSIEYAVVESGGHYMGGLHAVEHAGIAIFPLFMLCDRNDIGGICFTHHSQVGGASIFIYDGYPGGVGISLGGYERIQELLEATLRLIQECECENGCPSCVHSPKCGSGNKPLDKNAALLVLELLLGIRNLPSLPVKTAEESKREEIGKQIIQPAGLFPQDKKIYAFDLETQRSAEEVGGWGNKHLMRISVAVVEELGTGEVLSFTEAQVENLLEILSGADLIVGFNIIDFDYQVLRAYSPIDSSKWHSFDILKDIYSRLGYRISLDDLALANLGTPKTANGLQAIQWFREGKIERIIDYCANDVHITAKLFEYGLSKSYLLFDRKDSGRVKLLLDWNLSKMLHR